MKTQGKLLRSMLYSADLTSYDAAIVHGCCRVPQDTGADRECER
jgi:hypothetical protein